MAVWLVARSLLRQRWRSLVGLALVLAILGGLGLGALAGARRTQSSYPRFLRWDKTSTISVDTGDDLELLKKAEALPQVVSHQRYAAFYVAALVDGQPDFDQNFEALGSMDGRYFDQDLFVATEGRRPDRDEIDEVAVNEYAAEKYHYRVGQVLTLGTYDEKDVEDPNADPSEVRPKLLRHATITGIGKFPEEIIQDESDRSPLLLLTPAYEHKADRWSTYFWSGLRLRNGAADVPAFKLAYRKALPKGFPEFYRVQSSITYHAQQAIRPLSIALALFGTAALAAAFVLTALAIGREVAVLAEERRALRALGLGRDQLVAATLLGPLLAVVVGVALAIALAIALSPTMPLGPVRVVEPHRGISVDGAVLTLVPVSLLVLLAGVGAAFAFGADAADARARQGVEIRKGLGSLGSRLGLGVAGKLGLRLAFDPGQGRSRTAVRSVILATTVAVACLVSALTFSSSLDRLVHRPALYGWNWDVAMFDGAGYSNAPPAAVRKVLGRNPDVEAWGGYNLGAGTLDGTNVPMVGAQPDADVGPPLTSGRAPRGIHEVALGAVTARDLGVEVGGSVRVNSDHGVRKLRVVGIAVMPTVGVTHGDHTSLGVGAWLDSSNLAGIARDVEPGKEVGPNIVFVRFRPGVDRDAAIARFKRSLPAMDPYGDPQFQGVQRPGEIVNTSDLGSAPAILAGTLTFGSILALGFMLAGSVRRRRRDLAIFRTLGGTSGQLRSTILWQSMATVAAGLVLGVPLGIVAGRFAWSRFAHQLQVVPTPTVPYLALAGLAVVALAVANVVAIGPGVSAARTPTAGSLRAE